MNDQVLLRSGYAKTLALERSALPPRDPSLRAWLSHNPRSG